MRPPPTRGQRPQTWTTGASASPLSETGEAAGTAACWSEPCLWRHRRLRCCAEPETEAMWATAEDSAISSMSRRTPSVTVPTRQACRRPQKRCHQLRSRGKDASDFAAAGGAVACARSSSANWCRTRRAPGPTPKWAWTAKGSIGSVSWSAMAPGFLQPDSRHCATGLQHGCAPQTGPQQRAVLALLRPSQQHPRVFPAKDPPQFRLHRLVATRSWSVPTPTLGSRLDPAKNLVCQHLAAERARSRSGSVAGRRTAGSDFPTPETRASLQIGVLSTVRLLRPHSSP
mmetsp:Transcript_26184/g.73243  ORF Transcript_26184/g.73243 Transcript_26184/m.73243 type:complete len:286 (+) Transcript_26184:834-1691(+)